MADKWQAIHNFWSGFGIPAYDESSVPEYIYINGERIKNEPPYITYNAVIGEFEQVVQLTASVWYKSTSWAEISQKVDEIAQGVDQHKLIPINGGYMYIAKGSPFAQRMQDENDLIRRIYIVMQAEFFSRY